MHEIATGGMGRVYLCRDLDLNRRVALKILPREFAGDQERLQRFMREAKAASMLNHPNVATIHAIGEADGMRFIAMEFVEGQTIAEKIRVGPLASADVVAIGIQLFDALQDAHAHRIIHRDIKPGNVMVNTRGQVKVLDFGLARYLPEHDQSTEEALTGPALIGTVPYMSPEQILARPLDHRTDLFSAGVLLYEMVTGKLPFKGNSTIETLNLITKEAPVRPSRIVPGIPPVLEQIIGRCLEKDPMLRYPSASQVLEHLKAATSRTERLLRPERSKAWLDDNRKPRWVLAVAAILALIAVVSAIGMLRIWKKTDAQANAAVEQNIVILPFQANGNNGQDQAYSNGLTETLTSRLTRFTSTKPIQVVDADTGRKVHSVQDARSELGATLVVEGTLQRQYGTIRVDYNIVNSATQKIFKSDTLNFSSEDAFAIQDRLVDSVARNLGLTVPAQRPRAIAYGTQMPGAYDFYLQGMGYLRFADKVESIESAINLFQHAIAIDGDYGLAYAGMGESYWKKYVATKDVQWVDLSRNSCERALALDETSMEPHICLGDVENGLGKFERAAEQFQRALNVDSTEQAAYIGLAKAYAGLGRSTKAEETYRQAIAMRPQYWDGYLNLGLYYNSIGEFGKAEKMFAQVVALAPDNTQGWNDLGAMDLKLAKTDSAIAAFQKSLSVRPTRGATANLAFIYYEKADYGRAAAAYRQAVDLTPNDYRLWGNLASSLQFTGDIVGARNARQRARDLAEASVKLNPKDAQALVSFADFTAGLGKTDEAAPLLEKAIAIAPENPFVLYRAALVYESPLNDRKKALFYLRKSVEHGQSADQILKSPNLQRLREDPGFKEIEQSFKK
jgi:serine/threonine-protein kinase